MLEAIRVRKTYPGEVEALAGIDLFVTEGETVALVGESGSGKTTLLRMFNRLVEPTDGEIRIRGRAAREVDPVLLRRTTGYVQQDGGLLPHWSIRRNVTLVPMLLGWDPGRATRRAEELLEAVGLDPASYAKRYPLELSGGERQRVAFARALAADPDVVLLDEPFGALDALTRLDMQEQFVALKKGLRKTMVMVTHDLGEAFRVADHVAVMKDGLILQHGRPHELRARPEAGYVAELLHRVEP